MLLVFRSVVSYRSVPRILELFTSLGYLVFKWIPHFTSVINWTLRVGLYCLKQVVPISEPWVAILDYSIDIGTKKAFVVLRVPLRRLSKKGKALGLEDCECIGLNISEKTNGEIVQQNLSKIFKKSGDPVAILKDGGSDLSKGVKLWQDDQKKDDVQVLEDIGHVMANALKAQFEKSKEFQKFLEIVRKGSARLRQTSLAFLIPPKIRTKGRFQSISQLAKWGKNILAIFRGRGRVKESCALDRLRKAMPGFIKLSPFIEKFARITRIVNQVSKILKNQGFNQKTYRKCKKLAQALPRQSKVKRRLINWLDKHLYKHKCLGIQKLPLIVSSDVIECLFGKFKHIIERSPIADMNKMALMLPALCGSHSQENLLEALVGTKHEDIAIWEQNNIPYTLRKRRKNFRNAAENIGTKNRGIINFV